MLLAVGLGVAIQVARNAHDVAYEAALLAKGCPAPSSILPGGVLQLVYVFAIPVGMPLLLFVFSLMLFSPSVFGQVIAALRTPAVQSPVGALGGYDLSRAGSVDLLA